MTRMSRPHERITLFVNPTYRAITYSDFRISFHQWDKALHMTWIHKIVGHE